MSRRHPGGFVTKTPPIPNTVNASGIWTLDQAMQNKQAGTWTPSQFVDDVFSTYLYTGNSVDNTNIVNGIDLSTYGGMVWLKGRNQARDNVLYDTVRGADLRLISNSTAAQGTANATLTAFNTNGFQVGHDADGNYTGYTYSSWTFRKAPKFFDVVTYTGNSSSSTAIAHNLGVVPGMIIVKKTNDTANWQVWHRSLSASTGKVLWLNQSNAEQDEPSEFTTAPTSTHFTPGSDGTVNQAGATYVAYLFAHDTSTDGIIQCGSFTTDGSGNATVNLGYEPQYVLFKDIGAVENWYTVDSMRGFNDNSTQYLNPNTAVAETNGGNFCKPTATGFVATGMAASKTYIYLAIRRPNKPPTSGTQVYNAISFAGNNTTPLIRDLGLPGFDLWVAKRASTGFNSAWFDRLRGITGSKYLTSDSTGAEAWDGNITSVEQSDMSGIKVTKSINYGYVDSASPTYVWWGFKRAPGFFDVVCDMGTGSAHTVSHGLGVTPELIIRKSRSHTENWQVYVSALGATKYLRLADNNGKYTATNRWNDTSPTSSVFTVGTDTSVNGNTYTFVSYLFATRAGISKVGSYTGNGSNQTINCGFSAGARFILIKRTDSTGDWFVWDSVRGIATGNDPHLSLNSTAAEVTTDDSIDPDNSGFIVNQLSATNINVTNGTYIFLAIA